MARTVEPKRSAAAQDLRQLASIGPLEASVLRTMAETGRPATVRAVCEQLALGGYFAYGGILNCMTRLARKGFLKRALVDGAFVYELRVDVTELTACLAVEAIASMGADRDRVVCRVLGLDPTREAPEIARLRAETRTRGLDPRVRRILANMAGPRRG
jgi:predicted transcriptional regulator